MASSENCPRCSAEVSPEDTACPHCGAEAGWPPPPAAAPGPDAPPALPSRYVPKVLLGWGGMGRVFLCHDTALDVDVAIKVLRPEIASDARKVLKIETEAKASARLRGQPGILGLYGFESHGATRYLVMEYAAGGSVFQRLRDQGKIPEAGCRRLGAEIAEALAVAHDRGVIHRDIKPANILLDISGRTKVADFGLAHLVASAYGATSEAPLEGTPVYMPPEAFLRRGLDGRSDLYSLGVVLYEMATGEPPFRGSVREIAASKTAPGAAAPDPRALRPNLSPEFSLVVRKLLDADPSRRFPDARAAAAALRGTENLLREAATDSKAGTVKSVGTSSRSRRDPAIAEGRPSRAPMMVGIGVAVLAAAGLAIALRNPDPAPEAPSSTPAPAPSNSTAALPGILIVAKPAGADIFVDGRFVGQSAEDRGLRVVDVEPDVPHTIRAEFADHEPDEEKGVVWKRGVTRAPLAMKLVPKMGVLEIEGGPPGARGSFLQDGKEVKPAVFRQDGTVAPEMLPAGTYELEVTAPRFHPWKQTVKVGTSRNPRVVVAMAEKDGFLSVDSDPQGVYVLVDGKEVGRTPLVKLSVAAGTRKVLLQREDVAAAEREAEIRGEQATDLGTVALDAMATMDTAALPEGVTAFLDGNELKGPLQRAPGPVTLSFQRAASQPQSLTFVLKPGPNPFPKLGKWTPAPGSVDLRGLGEAADAVLLDHLFLRPPWKVHSADPGFHYVVFAKSGRAPVGLRLLVRAGMATEVPVPQFRAPTKTKHASSQLDFHAAAEAGIAWLLRHQAPDGHWSCAGFEAKCQQNRCGQVGLPHSDVGVTGLALLAVLGSRAIDGRCEAESALRGLDWLLASQIREGDYAGCFGIPKTNKFTYDHAIATLAVVEGCRATGSPSLRDSARRAVAFIEKCRNPDLAWRYGIRPQDNDTSVTAWMVQALREGADIGLKVDPAAFRGTLAWLDTVSEPEYGRAGYTARGNGPSRPEDMMKSFPMDKSESLTAAALVARRACGAGYDDRWMELGLDLIRRLPPTWDEAAGTIDFYYWYLGTRAAYEAAEANGNRYLAPWKIWRECLKEALCKTQRLDRTDCRYGSWDSLDPWGKEAGRVYSTALNVLTLEVPFRRSPDFRDDPETTTISLATDPPGATIFVDDVFVGTTPIVNWFAPAATLSLRLEHPQRGDHSQVVPIAPFQAKDLGTILLPPGAVLDLSALPRDATAVVLGRECRGSTVVRPGTTEGFVMRPGHLSQRFRFEARGGETVKLEPATWMPSPDWPKALFPGMAAPVPVEGAPPALPPGVVVHEGRLWSEKDRVEMVVVPALPAAEGSPAMSAFLVDRHEVTVAQFQAFCKASGVRMPGQPAGSAIRLPVVNVTSVQAMAYAEWAGKRLLTLDEWQRAAIGRPDYHFFPPLPYPWGTWDSPRARNCEGAEDGSPGVAPVGSFPLGMSRCGALDLVGNVSEWVAGPLVTGGSHFMSRNHAFSTYPVVTPEPDVGIRCAMDLPAGK